jgi:hypothetical protein
MAASALRSNSSGGASGLGIEGDANAERHVDFAAIDRDELRGVAHDVLAAALNIAGGADFGHHDDELVATRQRRRTARGLLICVDRWHEGAGEKWRTRERGSGSREVARA